MLCSFQGEFTLHTAFTIYAVGYAKKTAYGRLLFFYSRPLRHKIGVEHGEALRMCVSLCITSRVLTS